MPRAINLSRCPPRHPPTHKTSCPLPLTRPKNNNKRNFDLGQFERFRRLFHTPIFKPLVDHGAARTLSSMSVSERVWKTRVLVSDGGDGSDGGGAGAGGGEQRVYEFTMVQRLGGHRDGWWFTESVVADGNDWSHLDVPGM